MPNRRRTSRPRRAYTLIEVMVVLALAALVFAALAPALGGVSDRTRSDRFVAELIDLDARARLLAGRSGGCLIEHDESGRTLRLRAVDGPQATISQLKVPWDIELHWGNGSLPLPFDQLGRSADYTARIIAPTAAIELVFNGDTGWHTTNRGRSDD